MAVTEGNIHLGCRLLPPVPPLTCLEYIVSHNVSTLSLPLDSFTKQHTISPFHIPAYVSDIQNVMLKVSNAQSLINVAF